MKIMSQLKKLFLLPLCVSVLLVGCADGKQQEIDKLNKQVDSLMQDNAKKDGDMKDMMSFVGVMADGLDSIAQKEGMLFYTNKGKEGTIVDRAQLKKNLEMFENTIAEQKQRIAKMADSLKARGARLEKLTALVDYLNKQLDEKDNMIKSLRADLDKKNVNIAHLQRALRLNVADRLSEQANSTKTEIAAKGRSFKLNSKTTRMEYFGYFPATNPQYTIAVVMEKDGMPAGSALCVPLFKEIAETLIK